MHSIAPKTASANAANTKIRSRQIIGRPVLYRFGKYRGNEFWRLRLFSFGGYRLTLAALALAGYLALMTAIQNMNIFNQDLLIKIKEH